MAKYELKATSLPRFEDGVKFDDVVLPVDEPTAEEAVASEPEDAEVVEEEAAPVELEEPKRWQVRAKASYPFHGQQFTAYTEEEVRAAWHKIYGDDYEIQDCFVIE